MTHLLITLIPLGVLGGFRWLAWSIRRFVALFYVPVLPGHTEPLTVVTPVYQEVPELFRTAIDSWLANGVTEVVCVVDETDTRSMDISRSYEHTGRVRTLSTAVPGKRDALVKGWQVARTPLVALVDSDTIWHESVGTWVTAPFADPEIGGVGTRQNVHEPQGLWQNFADMYLDYRYYDEIAAQSVAGQAVSCLSGRTAVYRREILLDVEEDFMAETFLGVPCMSGDDKRLTTLLLSRGHKTVLQREARVWSTFPDTFRQFLKQRTRWARNTWRSDLRSLSQAWMWSHPFLVFTTLDKAISSFTLLVAPVYMTWSLVNQRWAVAGVLAAWWMVSRALKLLPHFSRRPANLLWLPFYIALTMFMAGVKIYALATVKEQKWLTRDVAVVDGQVQRTPSATQVTA